MNETPSVTELSAREMLYKINQHLRTLREDIDKNLYSGLELHAKTLQIVRLQNYRNTAFDEDGNWL
jgi:hypothetical protein